jgi:hypothetical protein
MQNSSRRPCGCAWLLNFRDKPGLFSALIFRGGKPAGFK